MKQAMIFIRVDFPAPLGPSNPTTSPRSIVKLTWSRAYWSPYLFETCFTSTGMCCSCFDRAKLQKKMNGITL
jgi:hypothetical protein